MKTTNVVLSLLVIGILIAGSIAAVRGQEDSIAAVFDSGTDQAADVDVITEGITASDVVNAEAELEAELESENDISIVSAHQTLTAGNGWAATDDGRAALANILFVS